MPNWALSQGCRDLLRNYAQQQAQRVVSISQLDFPLTVEQIQLGASGLTKAHIATLNELKADGLVFPSYREFKIGFLKESFDGLRQSCTIQVSLPKHIFLKHGTGYSNPTKYTTACVDYITATLEDLTAEQKVGLINWLNVLIRQRRIYEVVVHALDAVLDAKETPSAAHLHARWPTLTTVLRDVAVKPSYRSDAATLKMWSDRFRNPPIRGLGAYMPAGEFKRVWLDSGLLRAADSQLVAGSILPRTDSEEIAKRAGKIAASISHWERLPTDVKL